MDIEFIGQLIGIAAAIVTVFSFQCKSNRALFAMQTVSTALFTVSFALLGAYTGAALNALAALRSFSFGFLPKKWRTPAFIVISLLNLILTVFTYEGILSLIVFTANFLSTIAMWKDDPKWIRIAQLFCVSPAWIAYNASHRAIGGLFTECFSIASVLIYFLRVYFEKKKEKKE